MKSKLLVLQNIWRRAGKHEYVFFQRFRSTEDSGLFGANASGKSSLLNALAAMQSMVVMSAKGSRGDLLKMEPFRLAKRTRLAPSEFEITILVKEVRYQYGFSATVDRIHEEWLIAYPKGRPQRWFDRVWNEELQIYSWKLGGKLVGEKNLWKKTTRDNELFLSKAVQLNSEQLQPLHDWFKKVLSVTDNDWGASFSASMCEKDEKNKIIEFLQSAGIDIKDIQIEKEKFNPDNLPADMPLALKSMISTGLDGEDITDVKSIREDVDGKPGCFRIR